MRRISHEYDLLYQVGSGSFSSVHKAKRKSDNLIVAIKIFEAQTKSDVNLIVTEGKILKYLMGGHPTIPKIYDFFNEGALFFIIMEYLDGYITLLDWVNQYYSLIYNPKSNKDEFELQIKTREKDICYIYYQIILSINYMYQKYVVHRDLKLENIMINPKTKEIKIIDFGFSIITQTMTWSTICGSFEYLAPEILETLVKKADKQRVSNFTIQSEVWSLGIILYGMIYCRLPFEHENKLDLINLVLNSEISYDPLNVINNQNLKSLLLSMLDKNPYTRINFSQILNHPLFSGLHKIRNCRISKSYMNGIEKLAQEIDGVSDSVNNSGLIDNSQLKNHQNQHNLSNLNCQKRKVNVRNSSSLHCFLNNLSATNKLNEAHKNRKFWMFHNQNPTILAPKLIKNI